MLKVNNYLFKYLLEFEYAVLWSLHKVQLLKHKDAF